MPLELSISTGSTAPIYRQIIDQVCRAVAMGALEPGEQMPSVRALAERLVVNPNTIARTYADLVHEGILETLPGKGVFVARRRPVYTKAERLRRVDGPLGAFVSQAVHLGFSDDEILELVRRQVLRLRRADSREGGDPS
jgi:GntR family transcriptional regulator